MMLGRMRLALGTLVSALAIAAACDLSSSVVDPPPNGVDAGNDGAVGTGSGTPVCPWPFAPGSACADEDAECVPPVCRSCIGGFRLIASSPPVGCRCRTGRWSCPTVSVLSGTVADCVVETPLSCDAAKEVYVDAACTQHPACTQ